MKTKTKSEMSKMEEGRVGSGGGGGSIDEEAASGSAAKGTNWMVAVAVALFGLVFNGAAIGYTRYVGGSTSSLASLHRCLYLAVAAPPFHL